MKAAKLEGSWDEDTCAPSVLCPVTGPEYSIKYPGVAFNSIPINRSVSSTGNSVALELETNLIKHYKHEKLRPRMEIIPVCIVVKIVRCSS